MNEIATNISAQSTAMTSRGERVSNTTAEPDSLLNFVARAVRDPSIDVAKLEALMRMQREIVADDARLQFNRAMSAAQGEMLPVVRDATNDQTKSKYARLETIDTAIRPIYTKHGFCLTFDSLPSEGTLHAVCEVSHAGGHSRTYHLESGLDLAGPQGKANKTPLHALGSSISYLRRYLTAMIWNVVLANDDNDGNRQQRGDTGELVSRAQAAELRALMTETRILEAVVLAKKAPGLTTIDALPAAQFHIIRNDLLSRKNVMAQREAANIQRGAAA